MHPIILAIVVAKLYVSFKVGQKYTASQMRKKATAELRELNIPMEFVDTLISRVESRVKEEKLTINDFIKALEEVSSELMDGAKGKLNTAWESILGASKVARNDLAGLFQRAADSLKA